MKLLVVEGWIREKFFEKIQPVLWICVPRFGIALHPLQWAVRWYWLNLDDWWLTLGPISITNDIFLE